MGFFLWRRFFYREFADARGIEKALVASATVGLLMSTGNAGANLVNAEINALREGVMVNI